MNREQASHHIDAYVRDELDPETARAVREWEEKDGEFREEVELAREIAVGLKVFKTSASEGLKTSVASRARRAGSKSRGGVVTPLRALAALLLLSSIIWFARGGQELISSEAFSDDLSTALETIAPQAPAFEASRDEADAQREEDAMKVFAPARIEDEAIEPQAGHSPPPSRASAQPASPSPTAGGMADNAEEKRSYSAEPAAAEELGSGSAQLRRQAGSSPERSTEASTVHYSADELRMERRQANNLSETDTKDEQPKRSSAAHLSSFASTDTPVDSAPIKTSSDTQ